MLEFKPPDLLQKAIDAFAKHGKEAAGDIPGFETFDRKFILSELPLHLQDIVKAIDKYLAAHVGDFVASVVSGIAAEFLFLIWEPQKIVGILLGAIANAKNAGEQAANKVNGVTVLEPGVLAALRYRGYIDDATYKEEMSRHGFDRERAEGMLLGTRALLDASAIANAYRKKLLSDQRSSELLYALGHSQEEANTLKKLTEQLLTLDEYVQSWNRKDITDEEFKDRLEKLGVVGKEFEIVKKLAKLIPGPSDLVRFAVREAFSDEQAKLLDLDAEFPAPFKEWGEKQGLEEQWTKRYWRAHWELPSVTQAFEMFHRTTDKPLTQGQAPAGTADGKPFYTVIDKQTLDALIKAQDYAPKWRDKLLAISYNVLTRVDVRRMYGLGLLSLDGVKRAYLDAGYNEKDASNLAAFTAAEEMESALGVVKARMLTLFRQGAVSETQLRNFLTQLKIPPAVITAIISSERMLAAAEVVEEHIKAIQAQYFASVIDEKQLPLRLAAAGMQADAIVRTVPLWIDQKMARISRISITDLKKAVAKQIITKQTFRDELKARRLVDSDIEIYLKLLFPEEEPPPEQ
jgi:hypothetical protein